jgi:hypothetical protein
MAGRRWCRIGAGRRYGNVEDKIREKIRGWRIRAARK